MADSGEHYPGKPSIPRLQRSTEKTPGAAATSGSPPMQRRGFSQAGRTRLDRTASLPVRRQIRALLSNPMPSPAEQSRLQELTGTRSLRDAVAAAKRMLASPE